MKVSKKVFEAYKRKSLDLSSSNLTQGSNYMFFQRREVEVDSDMIPYTKEDVDTLVSLVGTDAYGKGWFITRML